jgi:hypothetical protein
MESEQETETSSTSANEIKPETKSEAERDAYIPVSFLTLSHSARAEKPAPAIFSIAKATALQITGWDESDTDFIHIGDDYAKDYLGAKSAGWEAILLDRDGTRGRGARAVDVENTGYTDDEGEIRVIGDLKELVDVDVWGEPTREEWKEEDEPWEAKILSQRSFGEIMRQSGAKQKQNKKQAKKLVRKDKSGRLFRKVNVEGNIFRKVDPKVGRS